MTDQTGKPNTNPTPGAAELTIAQRLDAASLPGTFRKKGVIAAGEMGLFVSGGQVKKTLGTGEHTLGRDESLVKIRSMPFSIKLGFFQLLSGDFETLDGILQATVVINDAGLFYRTTMEGRDRLGAEGLAGIVSPTLDEAVRAKTSDYESEVLCHESAVRERLATELEPSLNKGLAQRGLDLQSMDTLLFLPSEEEDQLGAQIQELRGNVEEAEKQTWETIAQVSEHLAQRGLASQEEIAGVRQTLGDDHQTATASVLGLLDNAMGRMESQLAQRAEKLSELEAEIDEVKEKEEKQKGLLGRAAQTAINVKGDLHVTQEQRKAIRCAFCRNEVLIENTFQCPKCLKVVCKDHRDNKLGWCEECARKYQEVIDKLDKGEVVVGSDGQIMTQEDFGDLVAERGRIQTSSGEKVATIKENVWYAKRWYQTKPKRYEEEVRAMVDFYPGMEMVTTREGQKLWRGQLTTWRGNNYDIQLRYPTFFPFEPPKAYVLNPRIEKSRHIYKDGHLCLFRRDDRAWQPRTTAATMISWVSRWLHCYEVWQDTGEWPGREHDKELVTTNY